MIDKLERIAISLNTEIKELEKHIQEFPSSKEVIISAQKIQSFKTQLNEIQCECENQNAYKNYLIEKSEDILKYFKENVIFDI